MVVMVLWPHQMHCTYQHVNKKQILKKHFVSCKTVWQFSLFDCSGHISHGFSLQLITELTNNVQFIYDLDYFTSKFSFSSVNQAINVLEIVQELFNDIPQFESVIAHARDSIAGKISRMI